VPAVCEDHKKYSFVDVKIFDPKCEACIFRKHIKRMFDAFVKELNEAEELE